jgi:hypothetical protein
MKESNYFKPHTRTICRINPNEYASKLLTIDKASNTISILDGENTQISSSFDEFCDQLSRNSEIETFSSQDGIWQQFRNWYYDKRRYRLTRSSVVVLGGHSSGKSYTLYGKNEEKSKG